MEWNRVSRTKTTQSQQVIFTNVSKTYIGEKTASLTSGSENTRPLHIKESLYCTGIKMDHITTC